MTYDLVIGDRAYSSWSLRGWLLFDAFGIPVRLHTARLYTDELPNLLKDFFPGKTAPTMRTPDGVVVPETIAIAEELASRHPSAGLWPADPKARAIARVLAAEMHAGFTALRNHCPMNLRVSYTDCAPPPEVLADLRRLETVWEWAQKETGSSTWLCGAYSAADAFFSPVASRIATKVRWIVAATSRCSADRYWLRELIARPSVSRTIAPARMAVGMCKSTTICRITANCWKSFLPNAATSACT